MNNSDLQSNVHVQTRNERNAVAQGASNAPQADMWHRLLTDTAVVHSIGRTPLVRLKRLGQQTLQPHPARPYRAR